jgi:hypothetical protein
MRTTTIAEKINQETTSWLAAETKIRDRSVETENSSRRIRLGELICAEEKRRKRLMSKRQKGNQAQHIRNRNSKKRFFYFNQNYDRSIQSRSSSPSLTYLIKN